MKDKNVCKFIPDAGPSELRTVQFIFESNPQNQKTVRTLEENRLYLVAHGTGTIHFRGFDTDVTVGDMVFGFPGESVSATGNALEYYYIGFTGLRTADLFRRFGVTPLTRKFTKHESLLPFFKENIIRANEKNIDLLSECALMYAFSKLHDLRGEKEDIPLRIASYTDENFSDADLSLGKLSEMWGYNVKYLSDSFKKRMGIGFSAYLRTLRIKHALLLMDHGVESVKNVAFLCGYQDPLYFSKVFREDMGLSPKEYLQRTKTEEEEFQ